MKLPDMKTPRVSYSAQLFPSHFYYSRLAESTSRKHAPERPLVLPSLLQPPRIGSVPLDTPISRKEDQ